MLERTEPMFIVLFEVQPRAAEWDTYLGLAKLLRPEIERIEGFIDNERFSSQRTPGRVLSLSTWRDEKALIRWRTLGVHHAAQERGRGEVFVDYHLRIGEVTADTHLPADAPLQHDRNDLTATGPTAATIVELQNGASEDDYRDAAGLVDVETYTSLTTPAKVLILASWVTEPAVTAWLSSQATPARTGVRRRAVRVIRDYGMRDRYEAPQFYPPVAPES